MQNKQKAQALKSRIAAFIMFVLSALSAVFYYHDTTLPGSYSTNNDQSYQVIYYIMTTMLSTLGWGLIIAYSQSSAISGLMSSLMAVAITFQIQPPLKYFYNYYLIGASSASGQFDVNYSTFSMSACVALLITLCALTGRLGVLQNVVIITIFNAGYSLSFYLSAHINKIQWKVQYFDNIGGYFIYLYSGFFALTTSIIMNCKPGHQLSQKGTRFTTYVGMAGTGFVFASFPFTDYTMTQNTLTGLYSNRYYQSPINVYFSMTASVVMTYCSSAIFGGLKIGVKESLVGVLSGGVIISSVSGSIDNIGACIAVGAFAGIVSGFWLRVIHPQINSTKIYDHIGIFGPVTINAFIGGVGLAPLLFQIYIWLNIQPTIMMIQVTNNSTIIFALVCAAIAIGIGSALGLIAGLICLIFRDPLNDYQFSKLVSKDFGLYGINRQKNYLAPPVPEPTFIPLNNQTGHRLVKVPL